tara:strand:+ start:5886 stop:6638 length:753 start_codon:yes stop_codon:yes gene_type:complete
MIYAYLDKNIKAANTKELTSKQNCSYVKLPVEDIPKDASMTVVHGVLRGMDKVIKHSIDSSIPWMCMDNGYLGKYKRVILNSTAPITYRNGKRFEHGTQLLPWRGGKGSSILVLPPSPPYMDTFNLRDFLNFIAHNVNIYTDKNIIVRGKPAKGKLARPLQEQLDNAYCVITWGSAVCLEAMRQGIPTISLGWCPAKLASKTLESLETDRMSEEPDRMSVFDNLTWSSFEREELPIAWDIAMENSKCQQI